MVVTIRVANAPVMAGLYSGVIMRPAQAGEDPDFKRLAVHSGALSQPSAMPCSLSNSSQTGIKRRRTRDSIAVDIDGDPGGAYADTDVLTAPSAIRFAAYRRFSAGHIERPPGVLQRPYFVLA